MLRRMAFVVSALVLVPIAGSVADAQGRLCFAREATITGTDGPDTLHGTPGNDVILALGGDDVVFGGRGNDRICSGDGADSIRGGPGADRIDGNADPDTIATLLRHHATEVWPSAKEQIRKAVLACRGAAVAAGRLVTVESVRAAKVRDREYEIRCEAEAAEAEAAALDPERKSAAETRCRTLKEEAAKLAKELEELGVPAKEKPKPPAGKTSRP